MANVTLLTGGSVPKGLESPMKERKVIRITDIVRKENSMTDKEKLEKLMKLADTMYYAAQNLTTDASRLHKAMDEYHKFIIYEYHKEEPVSEEFEKALAEEWQGYVDRGAATVDALEDNTQELAFAKGFYRGANWQLNKIRREYEKNRG